MTESARFIQMLSDGLGNGAIYALLAVGFVVIYKSTQVISFAQPALMVVGALGVSYLSVSVGWPFWLALLAGMVFAAVVGLGVERTALRPLVGRPVFIAAIVTLGVDIVLRNIANRFIGANPKQMGDPFGFSSFNLGGASVAYRDLAAFVIGMVVFALLFAFFKYSRIGLAMRASAVDQEAAVTQGVSVGTVFALSWALAGGLAAVGGTFVATGAGIDQQMWIIALKALPAIILGGLDSLAGAVAGGVIIGVVESLVGTYQADFAPWLGNNFAVVSPYVVMLLVLLVRPYGLFGTREVERV